MGKYERNEVCSVNEVFMYYKSRREKDQKYSRVLVYLIIKRAMRQLSECDSGYNTNKSLLQLIEPLGLFNVFRHCNTAQPPRLKCHQSRHLAYEVLL